MNGRPAVEASGLVRRFASMHALDGVDLTVHRGEIVLLLGGNGAGKTTLLRLLAGLLPASEGTFSVAGKPFRGNEEESLRTIGFLSHSPALYADLTAKENLRFFARLYDVPDAGRRAEELIHEAGLSDWSDEPVRVFSRGMKQRLGLARAFLHSPETLLLDEPFSGLDQDSAQALASRLEKKKAEGVAILLATHRLEIAGPIGDRVLLLRKGRVTRDTDLAGTPPAERAERLRKLIGEVG